MLMGSRVELDMVVSLLLIQFQSVRPRASPLIEWKDVVHLIREGRRCWGACFLSDEANTSCVLTVNVNRSFLCMTLPLEHTKYVSSLAIKWNYHVNGLPLRDLKIGAPCNYKRDCF